MVEAAIYILCFLTSVAIAFLLLRGFARTGERILAWTGLGFLGLSLNNAVLIVDAMVVPGMDLSLLRNIPTLLGLTLMVYGLIIDAD